MAENKTLADIQREEASRAQGQCVVDPREALTLDMLSSYETFKRIMFKQQYGTPFVMSPHFKPIFEALQDVVDCKCKRLIINMPPRYGKTEVVVKGFTMWGFALNPRCRFIHSSYSDTLVTTNSEEIREGMMVPLYKELFPDSALENERGSSQLWRTKKGGAFYAVSSKGQVTGFGAGNIDRPDADDAKNPIFDVPDIDEVLHQMGAYTNVFQGAIIIDDPLKPDDAESDLVRETINKRFENTFRSRVNSRNTPIIIIMQRLHEHDLCGYLQEIEPDEWRVLSLPALSVDPETGEERALWPDKHTVAELHAKREIDSIVFDTQYQQDPTPREGLMYEQWFKTYNPEVLAAAKATSKHCEIKAYIDTADKGTDSTVVFCFLDTDEFIYMLDCYVSDAPMEVTEPTTAKLLAANNVRLCRVESNNGGRGFARSVKRILRVNMRNFHVIISSFTQTQNKASRIFVNSASVQSEILFPEGWERSPRWTKVVNTLKSYRKSGKNAHDDVPDALTGVWETHARKQGQAKIRRTN